MRKKFAEKSNEFYRFFCFAIVNVNVTITAAVIDIIWIDI